MTKNSEILNFGNRNSEKSVEVGPEGKTSRRKSFGGGSLGLDQDDMGLDHISDEDFLAVLDGVEGSNQVDGTAVGTLLLTKRGSLPGAALPLKPASWVTALLSRHSIQVPAYSASYLAQAHQSGRQWPIPEDARSTNSVAAKVIYPPVLLSVDSVSAYRRRAEKLTRKSQLFVWHQLRGLYKLGYLLENPDHASASGMENAKRAIWNESSWANLILTLAEHLTNDPNSQGDCWFSDFRLAGGRQREAILGQSEGAGCTSVGAYPQTSVTFGTFRDGGPRQGVRFVGEKLPSKEDPKVYIATHRIGWSLGHPAEMRVREAGDRASQADHSCRDHKLCFNPWHIVSGTDQANKARKACRNGYARHCPCSPPCWFTDEITGHFYECLNDSGLKLRDVVGCSHSPNCCDYFDRVKSEGELNGEAQET